VGKAVATVAAVVVGDVAVAAVVAAHVELWAWQCLVLLWQQLMAGVFGIWCERSIKKRDREREKERDRWIVIESVVVAAESSKVAHDSLT